jgi:nitrite reductase/ring-hydroxylating ferredoxin subunit
MSEYVTVGSASDWEEGEVRLCDAEGQPIAVALTGGAYYAFDDTCTHEQCSLSDGELDGTTIICPCHDGEFDITTGKVLEGPPEEPVNIYAVRVQDDDLQVEIQ